MNLGDAAPGSLPSAQACTGAAVPSTGARGTRAAPHGDQLQVLLEAPTVLQPGALLQ